MSGRGRSCGRGGCDHNRDRGLGGKSGRSQNHCNDNDETEKVEFTPHCAGRNQQGAMCDTVKKQSMHGIRGQCEFENNLAESYRQDRELWHPKSSRSRRRSLPFSRPDHLLQANNSASSSMGNSKLCHMIALQCQNRLVGNN